jgi:hypothetical protein
MREAGPGFLRPRGVPLPAGDGQGVRPVTARVCSVTRLVSSARAARAARDVPAVTLDWTIEQTAWFRAAVKDT